MTHRGFGELSLLTGEPRVASVREHAGAVEAGRRAARDALPTLSSIG